jgi:hypothetical protein
MSGNLSGSRLTSTSPWSTSNPWTRNREEDSSQHSPQGWRPGCPLEHTSSWTSLHHEISCHVFYTSQLLYCMHVTLLKLLM